MGKQSRTLSEKPVVCAEPGKTSWLVSTLYYNLGGANMFTGASESRGYYVNVIVETREQFEGHTVRSFGMFKGVKKMVEPAARFSAKRLAQLVPDPALVAELEAHVLAKNGAALVEAG